LNKKIDQWKRKIDDVLESAKDEKDLQKSKKLISNLKQKLKDYRKIGLEKGGEMSYENLVFKYLRRSGHIEKLFSFKKERLDKELSLGEQLAPKQSLKSIFSNWFKPKEKVDEPKKADEVEADVQELYTNLETIDEPLSQQNRGEYSFQKKVESMQIGLELLGFDLPVHGVDGLYGPETAFAVKRFKEENDSDESENTDDTDDSAEKEESFSRKNKNLLEVNTFGFSGTKEGGNDGDWDGTMEKTLAIADIARDCWEQNVPDEKFPGINSQKRDTKYTATGRRGDHWMGSADSYAVDLPVPRNNRKVLGDKIFSCMMKKWNNGSHSSFTGGEWLNLNIDGYRYQFGWYSDNAHKDHIHVGVRKIDSSIPNTPSMNFGTGESPTGEGSQFTPEDSKLMIQKLKQKNIKSEDLKPFVDKVSEPDSDESEVSRAGSTKSDLPEKILKHIKDLEGKIGMTIPNEKIELEFKQEGQWQEDNGKENPEARSKIDELISDAKKQFSELSGFGIISGYRSYGDQVLNFSKKVNGGRNFDDVQSSNAIPGFSQHHTGKAFDIFSTETSWWDNRPSIKKWVADNCKNYGFEITYKVNGVLRVAEPWHLLYTGQNSQKKNKPTKKTVSEEYLIYKPENFESGEAHVLFAGLHSYRGGNITLSENFYGKGVDPIKGKVLVAITHWGNTVENAKKFLKDNYNANVTSIAGFSKGGMRMWDYVGPRSNMKFVGLIDPSPEGEGSGVKPYIDLDFGNNTYMVCNWKNWPDKSGYEPRKVLKWYCDNKNDSEYRGKVECTNSDNYDHSAIFNNFYLRFADKI